jgi:hypothetical protein
LQNHVSELENELLMAQRSLQEERAIHTSAKENRPLLHARPSDKNLDESIGQVIRSPPEKVLYRYLRVMCLSVSYCIVVS